MKLVIPVAGKGTRLKRFGIPKALLPIGRQPIVFRIIEYWSEYVQEVILIVSQDNINIYKEYFSRYYVGSLKIKFILQKNEFDGIIINGTLGAINSVYPSIFDSGVILNWCDVLLQDEIPKKSIVEGSDKNFVITTNRISCRWEFSEGHFKHRKSNSIGSGGIIGIFVINSPFKNVFEKHHYERETEIELLEALQPDSFIPVDVANIVDIGDEKKYGVNIRTNSDVSFRSHGSSSRVDIGEVVLKTQSKDSSLMESRWLSSKSEKIDTPKVISEYPMILEKLEGSTVAELLDEGKISDEEAITIGFDALNKITNGFKGSYDRVLTAEHRQYYYEVKEKINSTSFIRSSDKQLKINNIDCSNPTEIINQAMEHLTKSHTLYGEIHGDLQLSNIILCSNGKSYIIDPRPLFGGLCNYGDLRYDLAKLYYGFVGGWDWFSKGYASYTKSKSFVDLDVHISHSDWDRRDFLFRKQLEKHFPEININDIYIIHALIWLRATTYVINDTISSNYAYYFGTYLLNLALKKL